MSEVSSQELSEVRRIVDIASVQNSFNVVDRQWSDVADVCAAEAIAFIPWSSLRFADRGPVARALDSVAASHGSTRHAVALAWILHRSPTTIPIPGTNSADHVEENASAAILVDEITEAEWAALDAVGSATL